ncbi:MAG: CARDB domain-containing protein [Chloroflexota bacterium]
MLKWKRRAWPGALAVLVLAGLSAAPISAGDRPNYALAAPAPDIVIQAIAASPEVPSLGDTVTFTVTVKNQGDAPAAASRVTYYIDDTYQKSSPVSSLAPGATAVRTFTWSAQAGAHVVKAVADADNSVAETSETNNENTPGLFRSRARPRYRVD